MSTEYYLVCPEKKVVLELYKEHQYLATLNGIEDLEYDRFNRIIDAEDVYSEQADKIHKMVNRVIGFLRDCSGHVVHHFTDQQWIDWWLETYGQKCGRVEYMGIPGMSESYPSDWTVYEW